MLNRFFGNKSESNNIKKIIKEIHEGNELLRNQLIEEYQEFILRTVNSILKREIDDSSDEFSIGLIAFDEAVQSYKFDVSFKSYAAMVIKRRIIDFLRKEQSESRINTIQDDELLDKTDNTTSYSNYIIQGQNEERIEEIKNFTIKLNSFDIKFTDLAKEVPKHIDTRRKSIEIAKIISADELIRELLYEKKKLPIKDLLEKVDVSKKTLERNRKFIIAMSIVSIEKYRHLSEFLNV